MRKYRIIAVAALIWIAGGTYWYKTQFCAPEAGAPVKVPFYFGRGESTPVLFPEAIPTFKKTVDYLNKNTDKSLIIKGLYTQDEQKQWPNRDLGLMRAGHIQTVLTQLGVEKSAVQTQSEQREQLHFVADKLVDGIHFLFVNSPQQRFQSLNIYFKSQQYRFAESKDLALYFEQLKSFLTKNPQAQLVLTGHQDSGERSKGALSDKRLSFVRQFLMKKGFNTQQLRFIDKGASQPLSRDNAIKNQRLEWRVVMP